MKTQAACYGGMMPDLGSVRFNTRLSGKVFDVLVTSSGFGVTDRVASVKQDEWVRCTACPDYDHCYRLSVAKIILNLAVRDYGTARSL